MALSSRRECLTGLCIVRDGAGGDGLVDQRGDDILKHSIQSLAALMGVALLLGGCSSGGKQPETTTVGSAQPAVQASAASESAAASASQTAAQTAAPSQAAQAQPEEEKVFAGQANLPFPTLTLEGQPVDPAQFKGKTVLVSMGATWCPHCQVEMKTIDRLQKAYADQADVVILEAFIVDGERENDETIRSYLEKEGLSIQPYHMTREEAKKVFQLRTIPTVMVYQPNGELLPVGQDDKGQPTYYFREGGEDEQPFKDLIEKARGH